MQAVAVGGQEAGGRLICQAQLQAGLGSAGRDGAH